MHPSRVAAAGLTLFVLPVLALAAAPPRKQAAVQPKVDQTFFDARIAERLKLIETQILERAAAAGQKPDLPAATPVLRENVHAQPR